MFPWAYADRNGALMQVGDQGKEIYLDVTSVFGSSHVLIDKEDIPEIIEALQRSAGITVVDYTDIER